MSYAEPWQLRCGVQFLDEITEALYDGGAWVGTDASLPPSLIEAIQDRLQEDR